MERDDPFALITEDWLKVVGFKWQQLERQPTKHWLLWLGDAVRANNDSLTSYEDIGLELTMNLSRRTETAPRWFCWLRSDAAGRYHRFIHLRHLTTCGEVIQLAEAISGQAWNVENNIYGSMRSPQSAAHIRKDWDRLDRQILRDNPPWSEAEKDESRAGAGPEHLEHYIKTQERN